MRCAVVAGGRCRAAGTKKHSRRFTAGSAHAVLHTPGPQMLITLVVVLQASAPSSPRAPQLPALLPVQRICSADGDA